MPTLGGRVPNPVNVDLALPQGILQPDSIAIRPSAIGLDAVRPGKGRGAKQAPAEARAFLIGPIHQANSDRRPAVEILNQTAQPLESGKNAKRAIHPAAIRNRVKMTPQDEDPLRIALQSRPGIACGVEVVLHRQPRQLALKPGARLEPGWTPRNPLRPVVVRGQPAKLS